MLTALALVIVVLLMVIAAKLSQIVRQQQGLAAWLDKLLMPSGYEYADKVPDSRRTLVDQLLALTEDQLAATREIDNKLKYFRNYVWEEVDRRYLEDIKNPEASSHWFGRKFASNENPANYGLWMRERDMNEGFHRDVVVPVTQRRQVEQRMSPDDNAGESPEVS